MNQTNVEEMNASDLFALIMEEKLISKKELIENSGIRQSNISKYLRECENMNMKTFEKIMNSLGEDFIIKLKNGKEVKLVINKQ